MLVVNNLYYSYCEKGKRLLHITRHLEQKFYKYNHLFFHFTFLTTLIHTPLGRTQLKFFFKPRSCYGRTEELQASVFAPATGEHTCEALTCPAQSGAATCPFYPLNTPTPLFLLHLRRSNQQVKNFQIFTHRKLQFVEERVIRTEKRGEKGACFASFTGSN